MRGSSGRGPAVLIALSLARVLFIGLAVSFFVSRGGGRPEGPVGRSTPAGEKEPGDVESGAAGQKADEIGASPAELAEGEKTSASEDQESGPPALQGTIRNAAGGGVPGAGVLALNSDE